MTDRIAAEAKRLAGVDAVYLMGSHTHLAPVMELVDEPGKGQGTYQATIRYYRDVKARITEAVLEAANRLARAHYGWAKTSLPWNRNRHTKLEPKLLDREMRVLRFDNPDGKPVAVPILRAKDKNADEVLTPRS